MTEFHPENPLIVQGDHTVLVEVDSPLYAEARDALARFAELVKSPEHIHTYRVTPLSIWNACAVGDTAETIVGTLRRLSKYPLPGHVGASVRDFAARYGCLKLTRRDGDSLVLSARDLPLAEELAHQTTLAPLLRARPAPLEFEVPTVERGRLKQALIKLGFPTEDLAGYLAGEQFPLGLRLAALSGGPFAPRDYQREAAALFHAGGAERGGSGVIVLPCGAGKTIVGMACMALVRASTLILVTSVTAARQWKTELLERHRDVPALIIGMYVDQVEGFARELGLPILSGASSQARRDALYGQFRRGEVRALVVSKIANFSVDLPDAAVAIQVSGMFGSRQEEAQRLGRILRPKPGENQAHFYSIVSRDTVEQDYALNRQLFLCEQGYEYRIVTLESPVESLPEPH